MLLLLPPLDPPPRPREGHFPPPPPSKEHFFPTRIFSGMILFKGLFFPSLRKRLPEMSKARVEEALSKPCCNWCTQNETGGLSTSRSSS